LRFKPLPLNVTFIRGTTADEDGNVTMEEEAVLGEMLAMAQATRRAGGVVIVQVKRVARRETLPPKQVKVPGRHADGGRARYRLGRRPDHVHDRTRAGCGPCARTDSTGSR